MRITLLSDAVGALTLGHYGETTIYNDRSNHGCILKAFDIAIGGAADSPSAGRTCASLTDMESAP